MRAKEVALMNLTIHDLPRVERPREKLIKYGPDRLSNAELLAIILRTGRKGENVLALAARILRRISFADLPHTALADLKQISGIGSAKACELLASVELGKRIFENKKITISQLLSPQDVFDNLKDIRESKKEHFVVFFLDTRNQQIKREIISIGTINASLVHPREVFEPAVKHLAVQVILAHNHPSGDLEPSEEDLDVHKRLSAAGEILGIEVLDHIIVGKTGFMSFKEKDV
jgi:DNA repair protein RadC